MQWIKNHLYVPQYEFTSCNQYGNRFKRVGQKHLSVANLGCKTNDADGIQKLILLDHTLDVPVRYDFDKQKAYIEIISVEALKRCI